MNLIAAITELKENPDAAAISFEAGDYTQYIILHAGELYWSGDGQGRGNPAKVNKVDFFLRENFRIELKSAYRKLTTSEIKIKVAELLEELSRRAT